MAGETRPILQHLSMGFFGQELNFLSIGPNNIKRVIGAYWGGGATKQYGMYKTARKNTDQKRRLPHSQPEGVHRTHKLILEPERRQKNSSQKREKNQRAAEEPRRTAIAMWSLSGLQNGSSKQLGKPNGVRITVS